MVLVQLHSRLLVLQSFFQPALFAGDSSQLKMRVGLARINRDRTLELLNGDGCLPALLVDETELIMRISIVRIDRRCFQLPPEISPAPETRGNVSQLAPKRLIQEVQKEGRAKQ